MSTPAGRAGRVLGYVRVSGREQGKHGTSLDGQRETIARYAQISGLPSPSTRIEIESAGAEKLERRAELRALLAEAQPGDLVLVTTLDRWSRDIVFAVDSIRKLVNRGVRWISVGEAIDASTPHGVERLGLLAWVADSERQRIKARTVGRRAELRDQGLYVEGPAPYGTRRGSREGRRHLTLEAMPDETRVVVEAFQRCARGASVATVQEWLEVETGRAWDKKSVHRLLRNRVYIGQVQDSGGAWIRGQVPEIVSRELFERAQSAMAARRLTGGPRPSEDARTAGWLLRGLGRCPECGARMGAAYSRHEQAGGYYACRRRLAEGTCSAPYVNVAVADAAAHALALGRLQELRAELAAPSPAKPPRKVKDFDAVRRSLAAARDRAIDLASRGTISESELRQQLARLDEEVGKLELAAAASAREAAAEDPRARRVALANVSALESAWSSSTVAERREAIQLLARRIELLPSELRIQWYSAAELAMERGGK